jgi:hypothetical protein
VLLRFWKAIWRDPIFLLTVRHPYASALSWEKYFVPPQEQGKIRMVATTLLHWQSMMGAAVEDTEDTSSKSFVIYEQLVAEPEHECRRLADLLSRETGLPPITDAHLLAMVAAVDPALRRVQVPISFDEVDVASDAQKALYRFLLAKAADPTLPFDSHQYACCPGWREHLDNFETLRTLYLQLHPAEAAVHPFDLAAL